MKILGVEVVTAPRTVKSLEDGAAELSRRRAALLAELDEIRRFFNESVARAAEQRLAAVAALTDETAQLTSLRATL